MKTLLLVALAATITRAINVYDVVLDEWNLYKTILRRQFRSSTEEYDRLRHFLQSKDLVAKHNERYAKGLESYRLSINQFADQAPFGHIDVTIATSRYMEERAEIRQDDLGTDITIPAGVTIPDEVDWHKHGAVSSEVIDQESCGSCYAITSAGTMDALMYLKHNKSTRYSPQQIVDCSRSFGNDGCNGGTFSSTFRYLTTTGLELYDEYPYENKYNEKCKVSSQHFSDKVKSYHYMFDADEEKLKYAVATYGPMAIGIDARPQTFHFYAGGIYNDSTCGPILVHAVMLVGYGTDPKTHQDYWLIKNSWGAHWGEDGFMRMARNKNSICGVGTLAYAATLE